MKYYFGIVTCNKCKTANRIYEEYQGFEFELTNLRLSLSLVPDEMVFEQKARDECEEIPPNYTFHDSKISRALNHSTIKLTWDAADSKRQARMQAVASVNKRQKRGKKSNFNEEDEFAHFKDLIAGSEDESEYGDEDGNDDKRDSEHIEAMRQKLLAGIRDVPKRHKDLQGSDDSELDV